MDVCFDGLNVCDQEDLHQFSHDIFYVSMKQGRPQQTCPATHLRGLWSNLELLKVILPAKVNHVEETWCVWSFSGFRENHTNVLLIVIQLPDLHVHVLVFAKIFVVLFVLGGQFISLVSRCDSTYCIQCGLNAMEI